MAKDGAARLRLRPVGAADRKKLPEYGPLGTGCPAIERAVAALYKGQNEESFWALMNAINYALELDTRVLRKGEVLLLYSSKSPCPLSIELI